MKEVKQIGNVMPGTNRDNPNQGRVYDKDGLAPTISCMGGGNREPMIVEPIIIGGMQKNQSVKTDGVCTTLTSSMGTGGGYTPMIVASRGRNPQNPSDRTPGAEVEQRLEPNSQGICNALTTVSKDNLVLEPKLVGGLGEKDWGQQWRQGNRVYDSNAVAMALTAQPLGNTGGNSYLYMVEDTVKIKQATLTASETGICRIETPYRIRKLCPIETWRLMGFSDEDFYKAEKVNSNSQLYRQAGNSIVVNVLEAIFKQMF